MSSFVVSAVGVLFAGAVEGAPVVRIVQQVCVNGTCRRTWSSGTVIGRDKATGKLAVLTCAHGCQPNAPYLVEIEPGQPFEEGALKSINIADDLALVLVAHPARTQIIPIGNTQPQAGQSVVVGGFQLAKTMRPRETRVKKYRSDTFDVAETFSQGESGGPAVFDGNLVGVIRGNGLPTDLHGNAPSPLLTDGTLTCLTRIRKFVRDGLGGIPEPLPVEPGAAQATKALKPVPQTEPLPAAEAPAVAGESAKPQATVDGRDAEGEREKVADLVVAGVKAELPKILSEHLGPVEQRLQESLKQHGASLAKAPEDVKNAILPELPAIGKQVVADALPSLKSSIASTLPGIFPTVLSIAGAVGIPGAGGIALAGWLLSRAFGRHTSVLSTIAGHLGRQAVQRAKPQASDDGVSRQTQTSAAANNASGFANPGAAATTSETVNTSVAQVVTEIGTEAYQRMKGDLIRKNPALANDGTIKLMDSLFTQHLSGLQPVK